MFKIFLKCFKQFLDIFNAINICEKVYDLAFLQKMFTNFVMSCLELVSKTPSLTIFEMGPKLTLTKSIFLMAIVISSSLFQFSNAFNLETRLPVIKYGPRNSYFGYSVAEHLILDENTKSVNEAV